MRLALKLSFTLAILVIFASAQEVQFSAVKGGVMLSVSAQHSYQLMPGETKLPVLSVECLHKGKKAGHQVLFSPGGMVAGSPNSLGAQGGESFVLTVNGKKQASAWTLYGDAESYAYVAASDAERMQFLRSLLGSTVSIEFHPFLTGATATATFDLSKLGDALRTRSECSE